MVDSGWKPWLPREWSGPESLSQQERKVGVRQQLLQGPGPAPILHRLSLESCLLWFEVHKATTNLTFSKVEDQGLGQGQAELTTSCGPVGTGVQWISLF